MSNSISNVSKANKSANKGAAKQQSNNNANTTRRVVETRDQWDMITNHVITLITAYSRHQKLSDPRSGFGFGQTTEQPHSRAYAKSLIWGFATNKAGKVFKNLEAYLLPVLKEDETIADYLNDEVVEEVLNSLVDKAIREKIAIAILSDCKLVKGELKDIMVQLNKVEPKRERMIAESVLKELTKSIKPTTPKGGKGKGKSQPKKAEKPTTKGGKSTTKGGKKSTKPAAPKSSKAKAQPKAEDDVVVYNYVHFGTDYGVVTIPTLGKTELEYSLADNALRRYLKEQMAIIRKDEDHDEADVAEINDTLKSDVSLIEEHLGWSNEVTPKWLKAEQIVILQDNKDAKMAWQKNHIDLDDLTPLKGWKAVAKSKKATKPATRKSSKAKAQPKAEKPTTKGGKKSSKPAAPKSSKAEEAKPYRLTAKEKKVAMQLFKEWIANDEVEDFDDDRTILDVAEDVWETMRIEPTAQQTLAMEAYLSEAYHISCGELTNKSASKEAKPAAKKSTTKGGKGKGKTKKSTTKGGKAAKK